MEAPKKITSSIIHKKINTRITKNNSISRYNASMHAAPFQKPCTTRARVAQILIAIFCLCFALVFIFSLLVTCWPGPYNDYWADIWTLQKALTEGIDLVELMTAHNNAHRILIPRLLFVLDYQWFQGSNTLILVAGLISKLLTLLLLNRMIRDQTLSVRLLLNALFFAAILNTNNLYNILYSSNIQWDLMLLFSLLAMACHIRAMDHPSLNPRWLVAAYAFTLLGLFSHAGALAVLPVFCLMSLLHRNITGFVMSLLAATGIFYLTFYVLPVSDPENDTYQSALMMLLMGSKTVAFFVFNLLDSGLYRHIGTWSFYFSTWLLAWLLLSLFFIRRTKSVYQNLFLYFALFAVLVMFEIAAARSAFTPKHWGSSRFHGISLLFIAALSTHAFFVARQFFQQHAATLFQSLIVLHALAILLLVQYFSYQDAFGLSNKVLRAHAYMFSHQRNQFDGDKIVTFFNERDRIAGIDPFFTAHDLAYYANKQQQNSPYPRLVELDHNLLSSTDMPKLIDSCASLKGTLHTRPDEEGKHLDITWNLHHSAYELPRMLFFRNTYYLLDDAGRVKGFVYLYLDPQKPWQSPAIKGFASSPEGKYVVEINDGQASCLYLLSTPPKS
jgi:hypothetical protein